MHAWMDATFAIATDTEMEVNEEPGDRVEVAWTTPTETGIAALSFVLDRPMAKDLRDRLDRVLSGAPAEVGVDG